MELLTDTTLHDTSFVLMMRNDNDDHRENCTKVHKKNLGQTNNLLKI